jgi:Uma2 family endonuclease
MIAYPQPQLMTPKEYLEWEEQQPIKYEYINGQVFAMTGGTLPHNSIDRLKPRLCAQKSPARQRV